MALEAHGAEFFWSTSTVRATGATSKVPEVLSYSGPSGGAGVIDVTNFNSTAKEKLQGLPDEGNITLELAMTSAIALSTGALAKMRESRDARKIGHYTLKLSTNVINEGLAYVTTLTPSGAVDDKIGLSVTVEITGKASWVTT